jgi:uracil phosphoribosyltransferase
LLYAGPEKITEKMKTVHLIIERPEEGWKIGTDLGKSDLAFLIAYKFKQNWKSDLVLTAALENEAVREQALDYLKSIAELARIPNVDFRSAPQGTENIDYKKPGVTIFSMTADTDLNRIDSKIDNAGMPCLFALDSGFENAFA